MTAPATEGRASLPQAALSYARLGWNIFPVRASANSPPLLSNWPAVATTHEATLQRWWHRQWPAGNIGVHCVDMLVLDVDPRHDGLAALDILVSEHGRLPATVTQRTPSGGWHILFATDRTDLGNSVGRVGHGIDVRTVGGYIIVAPSIRPDGAYRWVGGRSPFDLELAEAPEWLVRLAAPPERPPLRIDPAPATSDRLAAWAFDCEVETVATAREGQRNQTLFIGARKLGRFCASGTLPWSAVEAALLNAALAAGLDQRSATATITSALRSRGYRS